MSATSRPTRPKPSIMTWPNAAVFQGLIDLTSKLLPPDLPSGEPAELGEH